jgi:hypothetical protein
MNIYNTQPLLNEIEIVIKNGLDKMLSKYLERYDLLEKTHKQLMNLPSIKEAIGKDYEQDVESDTDSYSETKNPEINNIVSCQTEMKYDVLNIESKLDKLEKKYAGLYPMLDKILDKIETLNNDVQKMKTMPTNTTTTVAATSTSVEPTIVSACQNENIKFEIKEEDTESVVEDAESLEDDTESLEDEDDVNPALITCATIKITKDALEVVPNDKVEIVKVVKLEPEIIPVSESVELEEEEEEVEEEDVEEDSKSIETETKSDTESVEDEEVEEKAKEVDDEDVEEELEVITIDDVDYCTNNEENGFIWELTEDGEQGTKVGYLKDGEPFFYAEEN